MCVCVCVCVCVCERERKGEGERERERKTVTGRQTHRESQRALCKRTFCLVFYMFTKIFVKLTVMPPVTLLRSKGVAKLEIKALISSVAA